jgi:hypothetical protein
VTSVKFLTILGQRLHPLVEDWRPQWFFTAAFSCPRTNLERQIMSNENERLYRIYLEPCHYILGEIIDGAVHVHDIVHRGQSEVAMTGERPRLTPIPLEEMRERGFDVHIEEAAAEDAAED